MKLDFHIFFIIIWVSFSPNKISHFSPQFFAFFCYLFTFIGGKQSVETIIDFFKVPIYFTNIYTRFTLLIFTYLRSFNATYLWLLKCRKNTFLFSIFLYLKNHIYLYSTKKIFSFYENFVIQRKYIYIQLEYTCV